MRFSQLLLSALVFVAVLLSACNPLNETFEKHYDDYQSLVDAGEIQRGWAPEFLPESATDIHLKYDLDENAVLLSFAFDPADAEAMTQSCTPVSRVFDARLTATWWPNDLPAENAARFYECPEGYLALRDGTGYFWAGVDAPSDAIPVASLYLHPDKYLHLDGQQVTIVGYVDFDNIHDLREMYYSQEGIGFVQKPGQTADAIFFIYFPASVNPHPLFDKLYALQPGREETGQLLMATGVLHAYDQPTNFTTRTGYVMDVADVDDVTIIK